MIITKFYRIREDGVSLYHTYSSDGYYIRQIETGNIYAEAIDVENAQYIYEETNDLIEKENEKNGDDISN